MPVVADWTFPFCAFRELLPYLAFVLPGGFVLFHVQVIMTHSVVVVLTFLAYMIAPVCFVSVYALSLSHYGVPLLAFYVPGTH